MSGSRACLLIRECTQEDSETKYDGKDQWLHFVSEAQELQHCLDSYRLSGVLFGLAPSFFWITSSTRIRVPS
jgi:hypothetical protein